MFSLFLICKFSNLCSNKKKGHYGYKAYPWLNGQYLLPCFSKKAFFLYNIMLKKNEGAKKTDIFENLMN